MRGTYISSDDNHRFIEPVSAGTLRKLDKKKSPGYEYEVYLTLSAPWSLSHATNDEQGELLMKRGLLPTGIPLALTWQVWTAVITSTILVAATLEQCKLDCAGNTTQEVAAEAALNGQIWSVWDTQRLVGPTQPAAELNATYPLAKAPFPLPFHSFCQLGCTYFFAGSPQNSTCSGLCDSFYARNVSVGINDYAEKVRQTSASVHAVELP